MGAPRADARVCQDPSLPAGFGIWVGLASKPQGLFLVAPDREDAEGWVDAIKMLLHMQRQQRGNGARQEALRQALSGPGGVRRVG